MVIGEEATLKPSGLVVGLRMRLMRNFGVLLRTAKFAVFVVFAMTVTVALVETRNVVSAPE
jgi:hypothetical protein